MIFSLALFSGGDTHAHPAHAEPVDYPFVIGFERFYSSLDDPDYLAEGGLLLINELNCVACHAPPAELADRFSGWPGTVLKGTGSRLSPVDLEMMIRNPRFVKRDTIMPSLFAGPDRDLAEVEALKHFLASLKDPEMEKPLKVRGDIDEGRRLYHRIGCVACHAPEKDHRPEDLPEFVELELTGLPSVPMNLADRYSETSLARFLLDPLKHRPSGRMPEFKLTDKEAADLAAYLKAGEESVELPDPLIEALRAQEEFVLEEELVKAGRDVFFKKNCHACHDSPVEQEKIPPLKPAKPLLDLKTEGRNGCFSARPVGGLVPAFFLDEVQKKAIAGGLEKLREGRVQPFDSRGEIDWAMTSLNCYGCHERDGKGGPETSREPYFAVTTEKAWTMGRFGNLPPPLTHVGRKLKDDWLDSVLEGTSPRVRTTMLARMPVFKKEHTHHLKSLFQMTDRLENPDELAGNGDAESGRKLFHNAELKCTECHGGDGASISMTHLEERIVPSFFKEILLDPWTALPGSPMPEAFRERKEREREIEDLWRFLTDRN